MRAVCPAPAAEGFQERVLQNHGPLFARAALRQLIGGRDALGLIRLDEKLTAPLFAALLYYRVVSAGLPASRLRPDSHLLLQPVRIKARPFLLVLGAVLVLLQHNLILLLLPFLR